MRAIQRTNQFKRDFKRVIRRGYDDTLLEDVVRQLAKGQPLPPELRDHSLSGDWAGFRECHIAPDWLLGYALGQKQGPLVLARTGSHSDLF